MGDVQCVPCPLGTRLVGSNCVSYNATSRETPYPVEMNLKISYTSLTPTPDQLHCPYTEEEFGVQLCEDWCKQMETQEGVKCARVIKVV